MDESKLKAELDDLCSRGLVMDLKGKDGYYYTPSPFVAGFYEFLLMRKYDGNEKSRVISLFSKYIKSPDFFKENFGHGESLGVGRALVALDEDTLNKSDILDYEKAIYLLKNSTKFAVALCACRHEKEHEGEKKCDHPLESCLSLNRSAEYLIRRNFAREITKEEAIAQIETSRKRGLVLVSDNCQNEIGFLCQCCKCCCALLNGINKFGYFNIITSSNVKAASDNEKCNLCKKCLKACPVNAISTGKIDVINKNSKKAEEVIISEDKCLGCGQCVNLCTLKALSMIKRKEKVLHPADFYERAILSSLERGTLPSFIFDNPMSKRHEFMRFLLNAFFKLPKVKQTIMSDLFRSKFLTKIIKKIEID